MLYTHQGPINNETDINYWLKKICGRCFRFGQKNFCYLHSFVKTELVDFNLPGL